ncbi:BQ2448_3849 [Microbotryum intermedium]|uniref:BQ2448_3849 protein n=1 Tax=Microbotryum intermedium TaxID=269621 RepID=A0A238FER3_9BASI|nr:BQ2448_3849 [Microbotryum intermedium]
MGTSFESTSSRVPELAFDDETRFEAREETELLMTALAENDPLDSLILRTAQILETSRSILASTRSTRRAMQRICDLSDDFNYHSMSTDLRPTFERFLKTDADLSKLGSRVEAFARHGPSAASSTLHRLNDSKALLMLPSNPTSFSEIRGIDGMRASKNSRSIESLRSSLQAPKVSTEEGDRLQALPDWTLDRRSRFDRERRASPILPSTRKASPTPEPPSAAIASSLPSRAHSALLRTLSSSPSASSFILSRPTLASTSLRSSSDRPWSPPNTAHAESPTSSAENSFSFSPGSTTSTPASSLADASYEWESYSPSPVCASISGLDHRGSPRLGQDDCHDCRPTTPSPLGRRNMNSRSLSSNEVSPFATPTRANIHQIRLIADSPNSIALSSSSSLSPHRSSKSTSLSTLSPTEGEENEPLPDLITRPSLTSHHRHRSSSASLRLPDSTHLVHPKVSIPSLTRESSVMFAESQHDDEGRNRNRSLSSGHHRNESGAMKKLLEQQERLDAANPSTLSKDGKGKVLGGNGSGTGGRGWWGYWNSTTGSTEGSQ